MKELMATSGNIIGVEAKKGFLPALELILIVSEPTFRMDAGGGMIKERFTETMRVIVTADVLPKVIERLEEWQADLEKKAAECDLAGDLPEDQV